LSDVLAVSDPFKRKIELWRLERLLRQLTPQPYQIESSDRPDVILRTGTLAIGVEITTSTPQEYHRARRLHHTDPRLRVRAVCVSELRDGPRRRTDKELIQAMTQPIFPPLSHEQQMHDWIDKVSGIIDTKRTKLNEASFQKFGKNWLFVDDEPGLPGYDFVFEDAWSLLLNYFGKSHGGAIDFDTIFIHSGAFFFWHENDWLHHKLSVG
jgi:hypothetical protein